jgi:hypothetical protein
MSLANKVISLLKETKLLDLDGVSATDMRTALRALIECFFLNASLDLGFCHKAKQPNQQPEFP